MPSTPNPVDRTALGRMLNGINSRIDEVEQNAANAGAAITVGVPIVDSTFAPLYDRTDPKGVKVTLQYANFGAAYDLKIIMVERARVLGDAVAYEQKRIRTSLEDDISDAGRGAQIFAAQFKEILKYSTQYDVIRLVAIGIDGADRAANPENTDFTGYPGNVLFSFTTPERFGAPPFPTLTDIDTQLDFETDGYDAYAIVTNIAPLNADTGAIQTYRQAGVQRVENFITRVYPAPTGTVEIPAEHLLNDADLDAAVVGGPFAGRGFCKVKFTKLVPGASYTLTKVLVHAVDGKRETAGSVAFIAGSLSRTIGSLTNTALAFSNTDPFDDGTFIDVALEFTQPWPNPVSLKNVTQDYKRSTDSAWTQVLHKDPSPQNDIYHQQVNAGTISIANLSTSVTGSGTNFTRWEAGWKIKVGAQTLVVAVKPTSDTAATVTTGSVGAVTAQAYTMVMRLPLHRIKVKPSRTYNNEVRLLARGNDLLTLTGNVAIGADGHILQDTAAPGSLNTPKLWLKRGKLHLRMSMSGLTNVNSLSTVEATITTGSNSLNLDDEDSDTQVAGVVYYHMSKADCDCVFPFSLKQLKRIFGDVQLKGAFRLTNSIGQTTSSFSALLSTLSGLSDYSPNSGGGNELWNGDFTNNNGVVASTLGLWEQYRITAGNFLAIDTGTTRGRWDQANHLVFWRQNDSSTNKVYIYQSLFQTVVRGDFKAWSFFVSSDSSLTANLDVLLASIFDLTDTWNISGNLHTVNANASAGQALTELRNGAEVAINNEIRTVTSITNNNSFEVTPNFSGAGGPFTVHAVVPMSNIVSLGSQTWTTTEKYIEAVVQVIADAFTNKDIYFCMRTSTTINIAGPYLQIGRVMQVTGKTPVQFDRKNIKERNTTTTGTNPGTGAAVAAENLSFVPSSGIGGDRQDPSGAFGDIPTPGSFILQ